MNQFTNINLYDVKAYVRKAQNAVLNFSEMEAKVREATNNEPWGTPTSVMQQIADATNNYQQFHEIMPFVFRRFTEKSANEWRQIYKAVVLLDYLVLNGSERVVDYARSHISVIDMLRHFGYIDSKGTDQGASIRKRSEELVALLKNVDKLRAERKKSKQLLARTGAGTSAVESSSQFAGSLSGRSKYAGVSFNSPTLDNNGFGGSGRKYGGLSSDQYKQMQFQNKREQPPVHVTTAAQSDDFEEYKLEDVHSTSKPENTKPVSNDDDDDDFADFQSAPTAGPSVTKNTNADILDLFDMPAPTTTSAPTAVPASTPNLSTPAPAAAPATPAPAAPAPAAPSVDVFDSLWTLSKTSAPPAPSKAPSKAPAPSTSTSSKPPSSVDDLLSF